MTLWLSNLAAYSIQLAVLVVTAAVLLAVLRVNVPRATFRFWQVLFASTLVWPGYQLWMNPGSSREGLAGGGLWSVASSSAAGSRREWRR